MNIYVLPALSGDCMIVDFGDGKCVLIDGGYRGTYPKLRELLSELCNEGKQLEYVILTHYDRDHIAGLIEFVQDNGKKGNEKIISVDHIVYNDFSYLYAKKPLIIRISITLQSVSCISNRLAVKLFGEIAVFFDNSSSF